MGTKTFITVNFNTPFSRFETKENGITYVEIHPIELTDDIWDTHCEMVLSNVPPDAKLKIFVDASETQPFERRFRKKIREVTEQFAKAVAIHSKSPLGNTVANLFMILARPKVPFKMFNNIPDAEAWLVDID